MTKKYNGHRNWNYWNVSLWINNDQGLYESARYFAKYARNKTEAAKQFLVTLPKETPDGAKYTVANVRAAMVGM